MSEGLPHCRAAALPDVTDQGRWLINGLWAHQGVGIVGGAPKCCKSWLGLDMAVSVASGTRCLGRYDVSTPGSVLCYLAEDDNSVVKSRLNSISTARALNLRILPIEIITAPSLRLDQQRDQQRLAHTVAAIAPRLLLLGPFVRLHRIDENDAGQVSGVLAYLRTLQREHHLAVVVVHHARKNGNVASAGQALRGSSDFHAWGDSNLYLRRHREGLLLTVEHRAAPAPQPIALRLSAGADTHLEVHSAEVSSSNTAPVDALEPQVLAALQQAKTPLSRATLRAGLRIRNERLGDALTSLANSGAIKRTGDTWTVAAAPVPVPHP
jgi:RecA-family ATPase